LNSFDAHARTGTYKLLVI